MQCTDLAPRCLVASLLSAIQSQQIIYSSRNMLTMHCPSCYSFLLALLFTKMLLPFLILQTPSKISSSVLLQKAFSESSCLSLGSRARISKFRWCLKLIPFLFVVCQVAGSSSLSNLPEEQDALVTNLCRLLIE